MLTHAQHTEPWVRPFLMEALIREGQGRQAIADAFQATEQEQAKLTELLNRPDVWEATT